jgi:hypothetical protein
MNTHILAEQVVNFVGDDIDSITANR